MLPELLAEFLLENDIILRLLKLPQVFSCQLLRRLRVLIDHLRLLSSLLGLLFLFECLLAVVLNGLWILS